LFNISQTFIIFPCYDEFIKDTGSDKQMMLCEWKPFSTDSETYTLEVFESLIGDEFEAMMFKDNEEIPAYIWTVNFCIIVKQSSKVFKDISFEKIPRNPVCE
jgi:hypothetical protein